MPRLPDANEPDVFEEMTLQEHLVELRDRVVRACFAIGGAFLIGLLLSNPLLQIIQEGAQAPQGLDIKSPSEPLTIFFKTALYIALVIALPMLIYQLVAFLAPGLTRKEKRILYASLPFISLLMMGGASYAFLIAAPRALDFLSGFNSNVFNWEPDAENVITFYLTLMIGLALAFQLPVVMFILAKLNIVSAYRMRKYRKYSFLVVLIVSAIITPTPDPINLFIVAVPLYVLYEVGIVLARVLAGKEDDQGQPASA